MKYCDLTDATHKAVYLAYYTSLDATKRQDAERLSEAEIDRALRKWDRAGWSPSTTPPDVRDVAIQLASAFYIRLDVSAGNPLADPDVVKTWLKDARRQLRELSCSGYLVGFDGEPIYPDRPEIDDHTIDLLPDR